MLQQLSVNKVKPAVPAVIEHQTSFDKAMRVRMAELVENQHMHTSTKSKRVVNLLGSGVHRSESKPVWWQSLYRSHGDRGMYDIFLNFQDESFQTEASRFDYLSFKQSDGNIPLKIVVLLVAVVYAATRFWWEDGLNEYATNPAAVATIVMAFVTGFVLLVTLFLRLSLVSFTYDIHILQRFHPATVRFYKSRFGQSLDNGVVVGAALTVSLHLVSQAMADACPYGTTMLRANDCNVGKGSGLISPEVMALAIIVVLVFQMVARGVSRVGLVCAWVVVIVSTNASLWLAGSMSYLWINLELIFVMLLSYELERLPLRQFIKSVRVVEASEVNAQLQVSLSKYQIREGEQALQAKRSMVRHIGHEIRYVPQRLHVSSLCV